MKIGQKFFGKNENLDYKIFENEYYEALPSMLKEGYRPITTKEIMQYRLKAAKGKDKKEKDFWFKNWFRTCDAFAQYGSKLVVMPKSELLLNMAQSGQVAPSCRAFRLSEGQF